MSRFTLALIGALATAGCASLAPQPVGLVDGKLRPCPDAPHCVSSDETRSVYAIAPLKVRGEPEHAWHALGRHLETSPRTTRVSATPTYLHVQVRSAIMGYTDDVEFVLRAERGEIAVRSCSQLGYYDFEVNRERIEALRKALPGILE